MKLVIDIPEDMYNDANILIVKDLPELKKIIANGTLLSEYESEWIPVSERLPEDGTWNRWMSKTGKISIERYKMDAIDHFYPPGKFFELEDAIAWQPLSKKFDMFSIDEIADILVKHGQHDLKFSLGDTIKYSPSEIKHILLKEMEKRR